MPFDNPIAPGIDLDALMQHVQSLASPYAALPNSPFFQAHPAFAGGLNSALIAASNTPQGHTIGENISGVARGLSSIGPTQLQHGLQTAMLPYEMMGPMLQQADIRSQIAQRQGQAALYPEQAAYDRARADWYDKRLQPEFTGSTKIDDKGNTWTMDKVTGKYGWGMPGTMPAGYNPTFVNDQRANRLASGPYGNSLEGHYIDQTDQARAVKGLPPLGPEEAMQLLSKNIWGPRAGVTAGAGAVAKQPINDLNQFLQGEESNARTSLKQGAPVPQEQWLNQQITGPKGRAYLKDPTLAQNDYGAYVKDWQSQNNMDDFEQYRSDMSRAFMGNNFQVPNMSYKQWRSLKGSQAQAPTMAPAAPSPMGGAAPSNPFRR